MHGDEVNGIAITQKLLKLNLLKSVKGTLIVIPTINIYGMMTLSRNLPDRRDIESSFPGSETGSFASRLAHLLTTEIFDQITHCIDLHTGEPHISKFSQIKTSLQSKDAEKLALDFQAPVIVHTDSEEGLLWLMKNRSIPTIIFETGQALRLDQSGVKIGVQGIIRVMRNLEMLPLSPKKPAIRAPIKVDSRLWVRSSSSGLSEIFPKIGSFVTKDSVIATISDPFGSEKKEIVKAPFSGIIISVNNLPILNEGEPIVEIAEEKEHAVKTMHEWIKDKKDDVIQ